MKGASRQGTELSRTSSLHQPNSGNSRSSISCSSPRGTHGTLNCPQSSRNLGEGTLSPVLSKNTSWFRDAELDNARITDSTLHKSEGL